MGLLELGGRSSSTGLNKVGNEKEEKRIGAKNRYGSNKKSDDATQRLTVGADCAYRIYCRQLRASCL